MASSQRTVDFLLESIAAAGSVSARRMFGEYAIYSRGVVVGLLCDEQFYLKPTAAGRALLPGVIEASPYPGAKPYLLVGAERWEDAESMAELVRTTRRNLPAPKVDRGRPTKATLTESTKPKTGGAQAVAPPGPAGVQRKARSTSTPAARRRR